MASSNPKTSRPNRKGNFLLHTFLRAGNSWPIELQVHQPDWSRYEELKKVRPEVFQKRKEGTRQYEVLCYGNPKTLQTYLEGIQNFVAKKSPVSAPSGFKFPGNVEVKPCGMPAMASYKEKTIRDEEQANIDEWIAISGRKIQNWHYCVWPAHKTRAAYQYPHVIKDFYLRNRHKTVGTFINGDFNHWPRQHISLYCWLKALWNPDFDVDVAVVDGDNTLKRLVQEGRKAFLRAENPAFPDVLPVSELAIQGVVVGIYRPMP